MSTKLSKGMVRLMPFLFDLLVGSWRRCAGGPLHRSSSRIARSRVRLYAFGKVLELSCCSSTIGTPFVDSSGPALAYRGP